MSSKPRQQRSTHQTRLDEQYGKIRTYRGWLIKYNDARGYPRRDTALSGALEREFPEYYRQYYYNHRLSTLTNPERSKPKDLGSMFITPSPKSTPKPAPKSSRQRLNREQYQESRRVAYQPNKRDEADIRDISHLPAGAQGTIGKKLGSMFQANARLSPEARARRYPGVIGAHARFAEWDRKIENLRLSGYSGERPDTETLKRWRERRKATYADYKQRYDRALATEREKEKRYKAAQRKAEQAEKPKRSKVKKELSAHDAEWTKKRDAYMDAARTYRDDPTPANEQRARTARDAFRAIDRQEEAKRRRK